MKKYKCLICQEEIDVFKFVNGRANCSCGNIILKFNGLWGQKIIYKDGTKIEIYKDDKWINSGLENIKSKKWVVTYGGDSVFNRYELHQKTLEFDKEYYMYEIERKLVHNEEYRINGDFYYILNPSED